MAAQRFYGEPPALLGGQKIKDPREIEVTLDGKQPVIQNKDTPTPTASQETVQSKTESDRTLIYGVDENKERGNWTGRCDFILAMLGYSVGLGNVWRFPYLCYQNGGGAFLLPYLLCMVFVGIPMFFFEISLAQFCSSGPMTCWAFAPLFKGIGMGMLVVSGIVSIYYNMIIAWSQFYMFASFTSHLPWTDCYNDWNTKDCLLKLPIVNCTSHTAFKNGTCFDDQKFLGLWNDTVFTKITGRRRILPTQEYWDNYVLHKSDGIHYLGEPQWALVLSLLLAWIVCFLCLMKGIKTTGKVVYFTAIFPYVVLTILLIRGLMLENAIEGIKFYIIPQFDRLADADVWRFAANQIFYSMGMGWGGLLALASYNRFHNNTFRDALIVALGGCGTSIFAGFVIFSYLGHMAGKLGRAVKDVATDGPGLAFVVYPEAVSNLPAPALWAFLFFFMLITLGLDSQFTTVETILTGILDQFPRYRPKKTWMVLGICGAGFLLGLPMTTRGGIYLLQLIDQFIGAWSLPLICVTEALAVTYIYGANRFLDDIGVMLGRRPRLYWAVCWGFIGPIIIVGILLFAWVDYSKPKYGDDYIYPVGAEVLAWVISIVPILPIPIYMIYKIDKINYITGFREKIRILTTPTRAWGPALVKHRKLIDHVPGFVVDPDSEVVMTAFSNPCYETDSDHTRILGQTSSMGSLSNGKLSRTDTLSLGKQSDHSGHSQPSIYSIESSV